MNTSTVKLISTFLMTVAMFFTQTGVSTAGHTDLVPGPYSVVQFQEARADLTPEAEATLSDLIRGAAMSGQEIVQVRIAAWSDNPLPKGGMKNLTTSDCELADRRLRTIKTILERYPEASQIEAYNMAERSSRLAQLFKTNEAELKSELEKGPEQSIAKQEFKIFRDNGGVSRAVVLIMLNSRPQ